MVKKNRPQKTYPSDLTDEQWGSNHIRHDRRVGDAEPGEPVHPAVLVHHRQRVGRGTHLAGAGDMLRRGHMVQQPVVQRIVGG